MKLIVLGRGYRLLEILESFPDRRRPVTVVTNQKEVYDRLADRGVGRFFADPAKARFDDLGIMIDTADVVIMTIDDPQELSATLRNFYRTQHLTVPCTVFTSASFGKLARTWPLVHFKSNRGVFRGELLSVVRTMATINRLQTMKRIVSRTGRALVVIWGNPDPDAIASAYALQALLDLDDAHFTISYTGKFTRPENAAMVEVLGIRARKFAPELAIPETTVITVDAQPAFFKNGAPLPIAIAIDHHPRKAVPPLTFADIRPGYGSTATIMTEYFRETGIKMTRKVATALYYGLKVDTNNLQRKVGDQDIDAFRYLRPRADENLLRHIELSQLPMNLLDHFNAAFARKRVAGNAMFAYLGRLKNIDTCVYIADFFIKFVGVSWSIVAAITDDKLVVIFRSDGFRKHAGSVAESLFAGLGTAGGHRVMARAEIPLAALKKAAGETSDGVVERWIVGRLAEKIRDFRELS